MSNCGQIEIELTNYNNKVFSQTNDSVIQETPVTLMLAQLGSFTLMCTPCEVKELAIGFMFTEGLIENVDDIQSITAYNPASQSIGVELTNLNIAHANRNLIVTSSCGFCGSKNIKKLLEKITPLKKSFAVNATQILQMMANLEKNQPLQHVTGGAHAAILFDKNSKIQAKAEDIGRHNALDKAIGKILSSNMPPQNYILVLSSRISFELVAKAAKAGVEIIIAVSAPSSLAIEMAKKWNITLCGFVRNTRFNIYTHKNRIK